MPKIRFEPDGIETDVPEGTSVLEAARACGAHVGSACGGVCACSTCHVYVKSGFDDLSEVEEKEEDIIEKAFDVKATSRLGCQARLTGDGLYVVEISPESRKAFLDEHPELR
ncbi:MAG: 2Fe-2S iron-sulfur cluster binding domain-containing protein [Myxococcales bacterium]|nr:2Fe-2S iron-sulfur cluster binding domain-containing protein [Myxococcales bacterium]